MSVDNKAPGEEGIQNEADKYDIIAEKKKALQQKKKEKKQFAQMSKNVISNTNKKLLRVIEHGKQQKRDVKEKLEQKAKKVANK